MVKGHVTVRPFYRHDCVTVDHVPGIWSVYSPADSNGQYFLTPLDRCANQLAERCPYGMLLASVKHMVRHTLERKHRNDSDL